MPGRSLSETGKRICRKVKLERKFWEKKHGMGHDGGRAIEIMDVALYAENKAALCRKSKPVKDFKYHDESGRRTMK
jgi:hypothetical protein